MLKKAFKNFINFSDGTHNTHLVEKLSVQKENITLLPPERKGQYEAGYILDNDVIFEFGIELLFRSFVDVIFKHKNKELLKKINTMTLIAQQQQFIVKSTRINFEDFSEFYFYM